MTQYLLSMGTFAMVYALMALGLNLVWGLAGMINLGVAGFFAVGAYTSAVASTALGLPIWMGMLLGAAIASVFGLIVAASTLHLRGDYLAIVTLGFAEFVRLIATNERWLTHGTDGLSGIPGPLRTQLAPFQFDLVYFLGLVVLVGAAWIVCQRLQNSPFGRVLRGIRDDETVTMVAGKKTSGFKLKIFCIGSAMIGLAGAALAHYTSYIAPENFLPIVTMFVLLSLTVGGTGNNFGAVAGAIAVTFILEGTRLVPEIVTVLKSHQIGALREILVGTGLILIMRFRPAGLLPEAVYSLSKGRYVTP